MRRTRLILLLAGLAPLLAGCPQVGNIRIVEDAPDDLETLIENHEYVRVRQLTGKYPSLDSEALQARLQSHERVYEQSARDEAGSLRADGNLHDAVRLLSAALQKIPHSTRLRELRNAIEEERIRRLRANERKRLLARGNYLAGQLQIYDELIRLEPPGMAGRQEHARDLASARELAAQLLAHARLAMKEGDLAASRTCLELSRKLQDSPEAGALQSELQLTEKSLQKTTQHKASIKKARIQRKQTLRHREKTGKLLAEVRQALKDNRLHAAREAFAKIPPATSEDREVVALQARLEQAVNTRVEQLVTSGDVSYRAEHINSALQAWNEALLLSPDNPEIRERTERANKVLARLEELKQQQR